MLQILFRTKFCFFENIIGSKKNIVQKKLFAKNLFRETNITRGANIIGGGIIPRGPTLLCGDPPISPLALNIFVELNIILAKLSRSPRARTVLPWKRNFPDIVPGKLGTNPLFGNIRTLCAMRQKQRL